jgi:hypothetical protein
MLKRLLLGLVVVAGVVLPAGAQAQPNARQLHGERVETTLTLRPDGSLDVVETITFRFTDRKFHEVERRVPTRRVDDIVEVEALMDGRVLPAGKDDGQAEIRHRRRELQVFWRFPETTDTTHQFTLKFRAMGAVHVHNGRANLAWHILPTRHRYRISDAQVTWRVPPGVNSLGGPAMEAEGWAWLQESDGSWVARKANLEPNETAILTDVLDASELSAIPPLWQVNEDRARQLAPAFLVGALVILVMGIGMVVMMFLRYHRPKVDAGTAIPADRGSLPPALGTGMQHGRPGMGLGQMAATFFDLIARDVLRMVETSKPEVRDTKRTFDVVIHQGDPATLRLRPHERVLVDALRAHMKDGRLPLKDAQRRLHAAFGKFRAAAQQEMRDVGYIDAEREWASRGMILAGVIALLVGFVGFVVFLVWLPMFGDTGLLVPAAVCVLGGMFIIVGSTFPTLTFTGANLAAQWAARGRLLKAAAKANEMVGLANDWLPAAMGFGLGGKFAKSGAEVGWLHGIPNPSAALAVIIAAQAGGGGTPGAGVGGAGVAGGGGFSGAR